MTMTTITRARNNATMVKSRLTRARFDNSVLRVEYFNNRIFRRMMKAHDLLSNGPVSRKYFVFRRELTEQLAHTIQLIAIPTRPLFAISLLHRYTFRAVNPLMPCQLELS